MLLDVPSLFYHRHISFIRKLPSALVLFSVICFVPGQESDLITWSGGSLGSIDVCALIVLSLKRQMGLRGNESFACCMGRLFVGFACLCCITEAMS